MRGGRKSFAVTPPVPAPDPDGPRTLKCREKSCRALFDRPRDLPPEVAAARCPRCTELHARRAESQLETRLADEPRMKPAPVRGVQIIRDERLTG